MTAPTWRGDPAVIVYAVRYALGRTTHAPELCRQAVAANAAELPAAAKHALVADITAWLDGDGADAPPLLRQTWVMTLATLGVRRRTPVGVR